MTIDVTLWLILFFNLNVTLDVTFNDLSCDLGWDPVTLGMTLGVTLGVNLEETDTYNLLIIGSSAFYPVCGHTGISKACPSRSTISMWYGM